jgi:hypothetical protein
MHASRDSSLNIMVSAKHALYLPVVFCCDPDERSEEGYRLALRMTQVGILRVAQNDNSED